MRADLFDRNGNEEETILVPSGGWQPYVVPRGATWLYAAILSGGGGGGGGASRTAGVNGRGGGGGSMCAPMFVLMPAFLLPERIYVYVGNGGEGGGADTNGSVGEASILAVAPSSSAGNVIAHGEPGNGGSAGGLATGGAGALAASTPSPGHTHFWGVAGAAPATAAGAAGGTTGTGSAATHQVRNMCGVGSGGGAVSVGNAAGNGGAINAIISTVTLIPAQSAVAASDGADGVEIDNGTWWYCRGGQGGAGNAAGTGYRGGRGAYGAGGGGGGAGTPTGGAGGRGGSGIVQLLAW